MRSGDDVMKTLRQVEKEGQERRLQEGGGKWQMLLVLFLAILGGGCYLYFFTDLIRSHTEPPKVVKAPMRKALPRKGLPVSGVSTSAQAGKTNIAVVDKPADGAHIGGQVSPVPPVHDAKPVVPPGETAKPPVATQQKVPAPNPAPVVTAESKKATIEPPRQPVAVPQTAPTPSVKPVPLVNVPAKVTPHAALPAEKSPQKVSPAPAPANVSPKVTAKVASDAGAAHERYVLRCGPFRSDRELIPARTALKKEGLKPVTTVGPRRSTRMYRLHVGDYSEAAVADAEKKKLLEAAPDAFVLPHAGRYELIAGSYREEAGGMMEQERLSTWGVPVELKQVLVPMATRQLTAGSLPTREAADALAETLKNNGISCTVVKY